MSRGLGVLQRRLLDMLAARLPAAVPARELATSILDTDYPADLAALNRHRVSVETAVRRALQAMAKRKLVRCVGYYGQGHRRSLAVWALVPEVERPRTVTVRSSMVREEARTVRVWVKAPKPARPGNQLS
jgi:hypothetical protein